MGWMHVHVCTLAVLMHQGGVVDHLSKTHSTNALVPVHTKCAFAVTAGLLLTATTASMACLASHMGCPAAVNEFYLRETGLLAGGIPKEEAADIDFTAPAPKVEDVDDVLVYRAVGSSRYEPPIIAPPGITLLNVLRLRSPGTGLSCIHVHVGACTAAVVDLACSNMAYK